MHAAKKLDRKHDDRQRMMQFVPGYFSNHREINHGRKDVKPPHCKLLDLRTLCDSSYRSY